MFGKYKYCGKVLNGTSFEDFVDNFVNREEVYMCCENECNNCCENSCVECHRNSSMTYCGQSYPDLGVYQGDHYDDVIEAIIGNCTNEIDCPDLNVQNSDETYSVNIDSDLLLPDTIHRISINNTEGQNIDNVNYSLPSSVDNGTSLVVVPDTTVTFNFLFPNLIPSTSTENFNIEDQNGNPIIVNGVSSGVIEIQSNTINERGATSMPLKTEQTISNSMGDDGNTQRGRNFITLPIVNGVQQLNFFGSKWRFTGVTGGYFDRDTSQYKDINGNITTRSNAYPDGLRCDWSTLDSDNNFILFYIDDAIPSQNDWATSLMLCNTYSNGVFTLGWSMPNMNELSLLTNFLGDSSYQIEELFDNVSSIGFWSSTNYVNDAYIVRGDKNTYNTNKGNINTFTRWLPVRVTNVSEL